MISTEHDQWWGVIRDPLCDSVNRGLTLVRCDSVNRGLTLVIWVSVNRGL